MTFSTPASITDAASDTAATNTRPLSILIADDDPEDRLLLRQAFGRCGLSIPLQFVPDGQALLDYLRQTGPYENQTGRDEPLPRFVILDLNMPRKNGSKTLEELRADEALRRVPVVVLTTSTAPEDVERSYELGANSFITKPVTFAALVRLVQALNEYWFDTVTVCGDREAAK